MSTTARFYTAPAREPILLRVTPRLASWMAAGHPDQLRLTEALDDAGNLLGPKIDQLAGPLALRLDIGLSTDIDLLAEHDLDNYAYPLATYLARTTSSVIVSVWCSKRHADESFVYVEPAVLAHVSSGIDYQADLRTDTSASTRAYKEQIHAQLVDAHELPDGPVSLELSFVLGPRRNWMNLWKPTIDALHPLLGRTIPGRAWHPRDGRITKLGLHCLVDPAVSNDVRIAVVVRPSCHSD